MSTRTWLGVPFVVASLFFAAPLRAADPGQTLDDAGAPPAEEVAPSEEPEPAPPTAAPPAPPPREESEAPAPEPKVAVAPARRFAQRGALLLSADDALPLVSVGRAHPLAFANATQVGPTSGWRAPTTPRPFSLDYAVIDRLTIGVTPIVEQTVVEGYFQDVGARFAGGGARLGYVIPLGQHLVLWPRLGGMHVRSTNTHAARINYETSATADLRLGWTPSGRWMLTLGPSVTVPLADDTPSPPSGFTTMSVSPIRRDPRFAVAAGLTVKLDSDDTPDDAAASTTSPTRFLLGVEHLAPILRVRFREGRTALDVGLTDTTNAFSTMPRLAFDAILGKLTVGGAASFGFVQATSEQGVAELALLPRVGALLQLSKAFAIWPRAGISWLHSPDVILSSCASTNCQSQTDRPEHRLLADIDTFAIFQPAPGIGITLGPSLTLPIAESKSWDPDSTTLVGVSAGMVLLL